jgi:hypothetical protein
MTTTTTTTSSRFASDPPNTSTYDWETLDTPWMRHRPIKRSQNYKLKEKSSHTSHPRQPSTVTAHLSHISYLTRKACPSESGTKVGAP